MKKQFLKISTIVLTFLILVGGVFAQDGDKKMKMDGEMMKMMEKMQKSPQHKMMLTYRQNVLNFAKTLREMAAGGKLEDVELARTAFAEIKKGLAKMDEIHQLHMSKMSPEMREKMKLMMEKMQAEKAALNEYLAALEKALQTEAPDASEVEKHAAALVEQMEKNENAGYENGDVR
jgi:vancomycin resistance protein YoaR